MEKPLLVQVIGVAVAQVPPSNISFSNALSTITGRNKSYFPTVCDLYPSLLRCSGSRVKLVYSPLDSSGYRNETCLPRCTGWYPVRRAERVGVHTGWT